MTDTGEQKRALALRLGAEKWIDFRESKNLIADVVAATDGLGPHGVIVSAATVSLLPDFKLTSS
jgi:propanol-preferring alcohol dehydrogenase